MADSWGAIWGFLIIIGFIILYLMLSDFQGLTFITKKYAQKICIGFVAIVPPFLLWLEHESIGKTYEDREYSPEQHEETQKEKNKTYTKHQHSQELAKNIWLGFVTVMLAIYFNK